MKQELMHINLNHGHDVMIMIFKHISVNLPIFHCYLSTFYAHLLLIIMVLWVQSGPKTSMICTAYVVCSLP